MRLESIHIVNFRQYRNVDFKFDKNGTNDLHIILGNNGTGKTNLLNAISWCLYEKEPHLGNQEMARENINSTELEESIENGREKCKAEVTVNISVDDKYISFNRCQEFTAAKKTFPRKPKFVVTFISPQENKVLTEQEEIQNIIKQYMPEEIREYFFFDGEQLDKYFINGQGKKIHEAIYNISQVMLLNSMKERLNKIIKDYQHQASRNNPDIESLNLQQQEIEDEENELKELILNCNKELSIAESEIKECNEFLAGKEGVPEKEKEYHGLEQDIQNNESELNEHKIKFDIFLREYTVLFLLYPMIKNTLQLINDKENEGVLPPNIDKDFLERMLMDNRCLICNREMDKEQVKSVELLIQKLQLSSSVSHLLVRIKNPLEEMIQSCKEYKYLRDQFIDKERKLKKSLKELNLRFDKIDCYLKNYQDKDKISDMSQKRSKFSECKEKEAKNKIKFEIQAKEVQEQRLIVQDKLKKAICKKEELSILQKQIDFTQKSKKIVESIEYEMMAESKEQMVEETMRIFKLLDWKKDIFDHIVMDEKYSLEVYDKFGYPMVGSCSAAERALLALSFTIALQKVSGYDSMIFIDTPVGRIDLQNRANFAEVLKKISETKQVIMTFTPSEYSKEISDVFQLCASTYKELEMINENETYIR